MSTLTEEEKRHIEEKVKYENEIRARYAQSPASTNTDSHGKKTYADQLSKTEIRDVIIPQFAKAEQITGYIEKKARNIQCLLEENKILEKGKNDVPSGRALSIALGILMLAWCCYSYTIEPSLEAYAEMSLLQKLGCLPDHLFRVWGIYDKSGGIILLMGFAVPFLLGFVLSYIIRKIYTVVVKDRKIFTRIDNNTKMAAEINMELVDCYNNHVADLTFLPEKYQNHDAASHILELFETCRVDSMKEAFNKYEEDLHNRHVEQGFETINETIMTANSLLSGLSLSVDQIRDNTSRIK